MSQVSVIGSVLGLINLIQFKLYSDFSSQNDNSHMRINNSFSRAAFYAGMCLLPTCSVRHISRRLSSRPVR